MRLQKLRPAEHVAGVSPAIPAVVEGAILHAPAAEWSAMLYNCICIGEQRCGSTDKSSTRHEMSEDGMLAAAHLESPDAKGGPIECCRAIKYDIVQGLPIVYGQVKDHDVVLSTELTVVEDCLAHVLDEARSVILSAAYKTTTQLLMCSVVVGHDAKRQQAVEASRSHSIASLMAWPIAAATETCQMVCVMKWHGTMPVHRRPEPAGVDSVRLSMRRTKGINRNIQAHVWPSKKLAPGACIATEGFRCSPGPLQWAWQYQEVVRRQGTSNPISGHAPVAGRALASASIAPNTITEITCERILAGRQRKQ